MLSKLVKARGTRVAVAAALVGTVFAYSASSPISAAPQQKTLNGSCSGADKASSDLLAAFGGSLALPFDVTSDVPAQLEPSAPDQPISFKWSVTISDKVTTAVAAIDPTLTIKNIQLDMGVSGPTATKVVEGRPAPLEVAVVAGKPATFAMGPFAGKLTEIGKGGVIKYSPKNIALSISLDIKGAATDINVTCTAPGAAAITSIKIPGSPDIKQPIELEGTPNSSVSVDVLGKYVTAGTDEKGVVREVKPETLKVVDGPGQVVNGQVVVATGAAGTTSSVTFEVCSGTLPGTNAVQSLAVTLPNPWGPPFYELNSQLRKGVAFTLKYGDETTAPINMVDPMSLPVILNPSLMNIPVNDWLNQANNYILTGFKAPSAADIQIALERLPSIGAGGVKVTAKPATAPGKDIEPAANYSIEFVGKNAEKEVKSISLGNYYSVFPQEYLTMIIDAAKGLLGGGGGGGASTTTTTFPGGVTLEQRIKQLEAQQYLAQISNDLPLWLSTTQELLPLKIQQATSSIDVNAAIGALTSIFSPPPAPKVTTAGELPIGMCSQGVIDVSVAAVQGATATPPGANVQGAVLKMAG